MFLCYSRRKNRFWDLYQLLHQIFSTDVSGQRLLVFNTLSALWLSVPHYLSSSFVVGSYVLTPVFHVGCFQVRLGHYRLFGVSPVSLVFVPIQSCVVILLVPPPGEDRWWGNGSCSSERCRQVEVPVTDKRRGLGFCDRVFLITYSPISFLTNSVFSF